MDSGLTTEREAFFPNNLPSRAIFPSFPLHRIAQQRGRGFGVVRPFASARCQHGCLLSSGDRVVPVACPLLSYRTQLWRSLQLPRLVRSGRLH